MLLADRLPPTSTRVQRSTGERINRRIRAEDDARMVHGGLAEGVGLHALAAALEQPRAEGVLDLDQHLADRGLAQVEPLGGAAHGAGIGQLHQQLEVPQAQPANEIVQAGSRHLLPCPALRRDHPS